MITDAGVADTILKQAKRFGGPVPDMIKNAPVLKESLQFIIDAFFELDSERINGFEKGSIPLTSILQYCSYYEFDDDTIEDMLYYIRQMDIAYLKHVRDKNAKK